MSDYWRDTIAEAFEDAGITATDMQIATVATWAEGAHDNHSMAHGYDCIPNSHKLEAERLQKELTIERDKVVCPECRGRGRIITVGPYHFSESECPTCRGEGKVSP